jgi:kynurenine formamidase
MRRLVACFSIFGLGVVVGQSIWLVRGPDVQAAATAPDHVPETTAAASAATTAADDTPRIRGWQPDRGWGWIWGADDQVGALNAMTDDSRRAALRLAQRGQVYDLGITYNRNSFKWHGHSPCEVLTFRSPEGEKRQRDHAFMSPQANPRGLGWHSCALFINDNVGTQIDGLAHITLGDDNHWYNGFREADWGGDFGVRRCDASGIPPIIARGVLLDIAGTRGVEALPSGYAITPGDIDRALQAQGVQLRPGDVVLIRTGTLRYWGPDGADHQRIGEHDSAGITLDTARYLVEKHGAMLIGSDTSGLEVSPAPAGSDVFIPVHKYLLIEQGVHIGEFHYLEHLARDKVYEFCYIATTNKIAGTTAGFALRPLAIR